MVEQKEKVKKRKPRPKSESLLKGVLASEEYKNFDSNRKKVKNDIKNSSIKKDIEDKIIETDNKLDFIIQQERTKHIAAQTNKLEELRKKKKLSSEEFNTRLKGVRELDKILSQNPELSANPEKREAKLRPVREIDSDLTERFPKEVALHEKHQINNDILKKADIIGNKLRADKLVMPLEESTNTNDNRIKTPSLIEKGVIKKKQELEPVR